MRKICVITGSRADRAPLRWVVEALMDRDDCELKEMQTEGLWRHELEYKDVLLEFKPHIVLILGDRYETLIAASVAAVLGIPIAHISGGEETEGAIDNAFRHAITKLAYWHFVANREAAARVLQLGEDSKNVFILGDPQVDSLAMATKLERFPGTRPFALVCLHPETLGNNRKNWEQLSVELSKVKSFCVAAANNDIGGHEINDCWLAMGIEPKNYDHDEWIGLMRAADVLIGNSSSFVIEGKAMGKKVILIGDRQKGREHIESFGIPGEVSYAIADKLMDVEIPKTPRKVFHANK